MGGYCSQTRRFISPAIDFFTCLLVATHLSSNRSPTLSTCHTDHVSPKLLLTRRPQKPLHDQFSLVNTISSERVVQQQKVTLESHDMSLLMSLSHFVTPIYTGINLIMHQKLALPSLMHYENLYCNWNSCFLLQSHYYVSSLTWFHWTDKNSAKWTVEFHGTRQISVVVSPPQNPAGLTGILRDPQDYTIILVILI